MTTTDAASTGGGSRGLAVPRRKRARQAPAARVLVTGAALTATGLMIAAMGSAGHAEQVLVTSAPPIEPATAPATVPAPPAAPPVTIIVIHRRAGGTALAASPARSAAPTAQAAPTAGRATPAPKPAATPKPVAKSSGS